MRFALLSLILALGLLAATVRAEDNSVDNADVDQDDNQEEFFDGADEADSSDSDDNEDDTVDDVAKSDECSPDPKTETKTLGGKEISQETENISVNGRCIRVLKGGSAEGYTMASNCARCKTSGAHMSCVGSPLAMSMHCNLVLGPDCNLHSVDKEDPTKECL